MLSANNKILGSLQRRCLYAEHKSGILLLLSANQWGKMEVENIWEHMLRDKECLLY